MLISFYYVTVFFKILGYISTIERDRFTLLDDNHS